jgi:Spy/CpxP family protein refolding chaperone
MSLSRTSIFAILLLSVGGAVALANPNPLSPPTIAQNSGAQKPRGHGQAKLMDQLNLTQEQKQKLKGIHAQYKDKISQRKQEVRQATKELRDLMAGNASVDDIRAKHKQLQDLRQDLEQVNFESMLATREVLTSEQRSRFAQLMEQRHQNSHNQRGNQIGSQT